MRILVTGGAGMIGSHLIDALLDGGNEIVVVENFLTGRRQNLAHLSASPRVHIVEADISTAAHLPEAVGPVDRVYHLASPASPASPVDYAPSARNANDERGRYPECARHRPALACEIPHDIDLRDLR